MKTTLQVALSIAEGLKELGTCKKVEDAKISYRLAKLRKDIENEMKTFVDVRKELVERLQTGKDESGQPTIEPGTPNHVEFQNEMKKLLDEPVVLFWKEMDYGVFNPKNKLGLSEDFLFQTFELWTNPEDTPEEPKPEAP